MTTQKDNVPTAEEFLEASTIKTENSVGIPVWYEDDVVKEMIEFARLHVREALAAAADNVIRRNDGDWHTESLILNAYPPENIK